jgi:transposase
VNLPLIYNGSQVLRIFHSDARFYSEQQNRICYVLQDMKLKLSRVIILSRVEHCGALIQLCENIRLEIRHVYSF